MKAYELLFFVDPSIDEETRLAAEKRIDTTITSQGGKVSNVEEWGKRKLAYAIDDEPEGFYALFNFSAAPEFPEEFYRIAGITDGVLRSLVVRK